MVLPAEIDISNSEQVRHELCAALARGVDVVVADLTGTTFCDASGIRALLRARDQAATVRAELRLAVRPGRVRNVLEILSLDHQ